MPEYFISIIVSLVYICIEPVNRK